MILRRAPPDGITLKTFAESIGESYSKVSSIHRRDHTSPFPIGGQPGCRVQVFDVAVLQAWWARNRAEIAATRYTSQRRILNWQRHTPDNKETRK